ncbi:MAG: phage major capsid protein [Verrucomicrobiales bacterium]|jgi:HK97 family phage major capsid protein|nr:phage major capsid protein [Verrucomicrobiales bacterium]
MKKGIFLQKLATRPRNIFAALAWDFTVGLALTLMLTVADCFGGVTLTPAEKHWLCAGHLGGFGPADHLGNITRRLFDADAGGGSGGGGGGIKTLDDLHVALTKRIEEREKNFTKFMADTDNWQKDTKQILDEFTQLKNRVGASEETLLALKKLQSALGSERRLAFGDPAKRIAADPELRAQFNVLVRGAGKDGEFRAQVDAIRKGLTTGAEPGSTLINPQLYREIYDLLLTYGAWPTLKVVNLGTKVTSFPIKTARPQFSFVDEGGALPVVTKQGTSLTLTPQIYGGILTVSLALLQDSEFDLTADVMGDFGEGSAQLLDYMAFVATGAADAQNKGFTGVFNAGAASVGSATAVEGLTYMDFVNAMLAVAPAALQRPCRWWTHPTMVIRALGVKDTNGRPIFLTALEAPSAGAIGSILGYPVTPVGVAPYDNAPGSKAFAFGNPDGGVVGIRSDFSIDASDEYAFSTLERAFRGWGRAGFKVRNSNAFSVLTLAEDTEN